MAQQKGITRNITLLGMELKAVPYFNTQLMQLTNTKVYELPFETFPTKGEKHDYRTCKNCIKNHKIVLLDVTKQYTGKATLKAFPYCCVEHSMLTHLPVFKKTDFDKVPKMVADKVIFTLDHIKNNIENDNFYNEITDYIEYTATSFGQMPVNKEPLFLSTYIKHVSHYLETNISENKNCEIILDFIKQNYSESEPNSKNKTENKADLESLLKIYENWVEIFPFDISFFSNLKDHFQKQIPILNGELHYNKYLGVSRAKMHTKSGLLDVLLNLTNTLITTLNSAALHKEGRLTEPEKVKLELIVAQRELKLKQGYLLTDKKDNQQFTDVLNEWFADEKSFIDEVTPIIKALPPQQFQPISGSKTKTLIIEKFENFDNNGWNYAFQNETDFNLFADLLTNYFEFADYQIPTNIIQLKRGCKTKLAKLLGEIQKELSQLNLSNDKEFFRIIRVLNHFEKEPESDLYKALTR